jgi:hypothetical protein
MKGLYGYLCEAFNIGAGFTLDDCVTYFTSHIKKTKKFEFELKEFVNFIYGLWEDKFNNEKSLTPFRFSNNAVKLHKCYMCFSQDIKNYCEKIGLVFKDQSGGFSINGQKITWGEGSLFKNRAEKGLQYEDTVVNEIILFLNMVCPLLRGDIKNKSKIKFEDLGLDDSFKRMWDIFTYDNKKQSFDGILCDMIKNPSIDLSQHVFKTGTTNVERNKRGQIFNKFNFEINKNVNDVLEESGDIISDVTVMSSSGPLYISVKMKVAQTSGVQFLNAFGNEAFQTGIINHTPFEEVENSSQMTGFKNLCKLFGIDPREVYNCYLNDEFGDLTMGKYDSEVIGELIQMIIGGNYWYVNPKYVKFIDEKNKNFKVDISSAKITDSGKSLDFICSINGINSKIRLRTSGERPNWKVQAPYRLFVYTDIMKLYSK